MPRVDQVTIFLASPGDVSDERARAESVIAELNRTLAERLGVVLRLVGWDTDTYPAFGADPQALINQQIGDMWRYDVFVGVFWNRLGTPTPRASSGTAEEFERAATTYQEHSRPAIWVYFSSATASLDTREKLAQKDALLQFKDSLRRRALTGDYSSPGDFERQFREDLSRWLNNRPHGDGGRAMSRLANFGGRRVTTDQRRVAHALIEITLSADAGAD